MTSIFDAGWLGSAKKIVSPNQDHRPDGMPVSLVVIHAISLPPDEFGGEGVIEFFTNRLDAAAHPYYATIADIRRVYSVCFLR
jgi:N-acetyl-anhydromuramoyl-L-alanine amidase